MSTHTAAATQEHTVTAPAPPPSSRSDGWRGDLDLQHWSTATFHRDLVATIQKLTAAHGHEQSGVMLDAAELYMTHMLLYEASSTLEGIEATLPEHTRRHQALSHAQALLSGTAVPEFDKSPLADPGRPDNAFWRALQAIAVGDVGMLNANIEASFVGLSLQSRAVLRAMLPVFIEAAIETEQFDYAEAALRLMFELPDLDYSPTGYFLRGRTEERQNNNSSALTAYFEAAKGWDQYAVRARLAIADMSLRDGGEGALMAAQDILTEGMEAWRGGQYEIEVLKRLARVLSARGDDIAGLLTLGKLIARFPASPEAKVAETQAKTLMAHLYQEGREGQFTLADWMKAHLQLLPFFRTLPEFAQHTETFADYLLELGATDLAAKEFQRAIRLLEEEKSAASETVSEDLFRLNLKLATAQLRAGLFAEALATLEQTEMIPGAPRAQAYTALKASVLAGLGDRQALLDTQVATPSSDHLRKRAMALAEEEQWDKARDVLMQFWDQHPDSFSVQDATHLLIAANRSDDPETRARVVQAFPALTSNETLVELAESLNVEAPQLLPLRADQAAARLEKLDEAFESIKKSGISP